MSESTTLYCDRHQHLAVSKPPTICAACYSEARRDLARLTASADRARDLDQELQELLLAIRPSLRFLLAVRGQARWSAATFGPFASARVEGLLKHIEKELQEVRDDLAAGRQSEARVELVDVLVLAIDALFQLGTEPEQILQIYIAKMRENQARTWPDWRQADPQQPIEHVRGTSTATTTGGPTT